MIVRDLYHRRRQRILKRIGVAEQRGDDGEVDRCLAELQRLAQWRREQMARRLACSP